MTLRRIPGGLVLGLLASLAAHTALFGAQHVVGGASHAAIMQLAEAGVCGFVALVAVLAWVQAARMTDGSVLAGRLRARLPHGVSVIVFAALWYAAIEAVEPHHAGVSAALLLAVLVLASAAVFGLAHALSDTLARMAVAIAHPPFSPRLPAWRPRRRSLLLPRYAILVRRLFARPPPIRVAFSRA